MVKIDRTPQPPKSLAIEAQKAHGSYCLDDVISQLCSDFHGKCYLCEIKPLQSVEIEHLRPHHHFARKELAFDWNNLFYACRHCNGMKNMTRYDGHILDCCAVDPEELLDQSFSEGHVRVQAKNGGEDAELTAELIESCFEKTNTGIRVIECQTRVDELNQEMNILYTNLGKLGDDAAHLRALRSLRSQLSRHSKFAAFKRHYVRCHISEYPELEEFLQ